MLLNEHNEYAAALRVYVEFRQRNGGRFEPNDFSKWCEACIKEAELTRKVEPKMIRDFKHIREELCSKKQKS